MSKTLDQERAEFIWKKIVELKQKSPAILDSYTKLSKGAGTLIMQNGLMPTLAFYGDKAGGAKSLGGGNEHDYLMTHLLSWLQRQKLITSTDFEGAMNTLVTKTSADYRLITEESLALIRWIRQFASALNEKKKGD